MKHHTAIHFASILCLASAMSTAQAEGPVQPVNCDIQQTTLAETGQKTPEISTAELSRILATHKAIVFDARPHLEYAISHIPGAVNVSAKPGVSKALYISDTEEVNRLQQGDKNAEVIVYCNGPFCGKSKRLTEELINNGYTHVKRYQLGVPVWRALGHATQIETDGIAYVYQQDKTAVWIDARDAGEFSAGTLPGARNLPAAALTSETMKQAKEDGRLPVNDHNTRVIVFGQNGKQAQQTAQRIATEAFHNVSFFDGQYQQVRAAVK